MAIPTKPCEEFRARRGLPSAALPPHHPVTHQLISKHFPKSTRLQVSTATSETLPTMDFECQREEEKRQAAQGRKEGLLVCLSQRELQLLLACKERQREGYGKLSLSKTHPLHMITLVLKGFSLCANMAISEPGQSVLKLGGDTRSSHKLQCPPCVFLNQIYDGYKLYAPSVICCLQHSGEITCCPF